MTRDDLIAKIGAACTVLDNQRLRRVAKFAYEQVEHQKRALAFGQAQPIALQAEAEWWASHDIPTAADPAEVEPRAQPSPIVYMPTPSPNLWT